MQPLLPLLLPLLWGVECVGGWGSQAGAGAPTNPWSLPGFWGLDDRYQLQVEKFVTVQEGLCVFIPCTFFHPKSSYWKVSNPVLGYWSRKEANNVSQTLDAPVTTDDPDREVKEETKSRFQLLGDPQNGRYSLVIRDTQRRDTAQHFFQVECWYYGNSDVMKYTLSLEVTGLTQKTDVYVPETLEPGRQVTQFCVFPSDFEGCLAPTFSWTGAAVSPQRVGPRTSFSALTLTPRPQDHDTELTCPVKFSRNGVSTESTIRLSVARKSKCGIEFAQAAFVEAGLAALFFLCPGLIFLIVKPRRRKATKTAAGRSDAPSVLGMIAWGHRQESQPGGPLDCPPPAMDTPTSGEEQELHYAFLIFHGLRPQEPQGQEATSTTEYSEIKVHQ